MVLVIFGKRYFMLKYTVLSLGLLFCIGSFAQNPDKFKEITIFPGQTLYSVARDYKIDVKLLKKYNSKYAPDFKLKIGDVLKLPVFMSDKDKSETIVKPIEIKDTTTTVVETSKEAVSPSATLENKIHVVAKKETLYSIAKAYNTNVIELKKLNNLPEDLSIKIGQKLIVGKEEVASKENSKAEAKSNSPQKNTAASSNATSEKQQAATLKNELKKADDKKVEKFMNENLVLEESFGNTVNKNTKKTLRGIGKFSNESELTSASFAYYDNASMGEIIKVSNLMSKRIVYMKVVGPIPAKLKEEEIVLVVSNEAAKVLGTTEAKFLVEVISY